MNITKASIHFAAASTLAGIATVAGAASLAIRGDNPMSKLARSALQSISREAFASMAESTVHGILALAAPPAIEQRLTRAERKRRRRALADREARARGWVHEWRLLGADALADRAARIAREPPEMHSWVVRQTHERVMEDFS